MADVNEQMDDLLTSNSVEKNKDMSMSDIFSFDRFKKEALPQFREKDEIIEKATATGTGLLTGTLGLPSDIVSLASAGADVADKYIDSSNVTIMKDFLNRAEQEIGRPAFDKKFTEITGLESNPANVDQLIGEIISPTGAFLVPLKTLNKLFTPMKKGMSEFFNNIPTSGGSLKPANNAPIQATKKDDAIAPNQPIINLSEIGIKTPDGAEAANIYRYFEGKELEKIGMGNDYTAEGYAKLSDEVKDRLYKQTGVYRGQLGTKDPKTGRYKDGKLRYKLSTADFQFNEGYLKDLGVIEGGFNSKNIPAEGITLEQMLNAKDLYRNYASVASNGDYGLIKDIKVKNFDTYINERKLDPAEAMKELGGTEAIYSRHGGAETIYVRGGKSSDVRANLLHEIQHAIQHREGFNAGSSGNRFLYANTNFGNTYTSLVTNVNVEKKVARSAFEQSPVGRTLDKELLESVTDKLVKREYKNIVGQYNKTESDGYFKELPLADIGSFDKSGVQLMVEPKVYKGYDTRDIRFTRNEEELANSLSRSPVYQDYIKKRIITQHKARNLVLMEAEAHKLYIKAPGEVQARKIVEDDIEYQRILKMAEKDPRVKIPTDPVKRDIFINNIFRNTMRPSEKGVLQGQSVKVDSGGNTTSPIRVEGEQ